MRLTGTAAALVLLAGCSSSSKSAAVQPVSPAGGSTTAAPTTTAASAPAASATSSAAASGGAASSSPAPASTGATTSAAPTTKAKPTKAAPTTTGGGNGGGGAGSATSAPDPRDPSVKTMRAWFAAAAKAINAKKYDTPALDKLMTPQFRTRLKVMLSSDIGLYYPGPVPTLPLSVIEKGPGLRYIETCDVLNGFAQDPKTHKPAHPLQVAAGEVHLEQRNGQWVMQDWIPGTGRSCKGVAVPTPSW